MRPRWSSAVAGLGYVAWILALGAAIAGVSDAPTLAAAQTLALVGSAIVKRTSSVA